MSHLRHGSGLWLLSSEGHVESTSLEEHISWVLTQIEPIRPTFLRLVRRLEASADMFCFWESKTGQGGPDFTPNVLSRLARLKLPLALDIYFAEAAL